MELHSQEFVFYVRKIFLNLKGSLDASVASSKKTNMVQQYILCES